MSLPIQIGNGFRLVGSRDSGTATSISSGNLLARLRCRHSSTVSRLNVSIAWPISIHHYRKKCSTTIQARIDARAFHGNDWTVR
jgi:hypothetical protein